MKNARATILFILVGSAIGCGSTAPSRLSSPPTPDIGTGQQVVARIAALEPKSYTDHLDDGSLVVSDVFVFHVTEPRELAGITVHAYYQRRPEIDGHILTVGDLVGFRLPSEVQRSGILLWDLRDLRLCETTTIQSCGAAFYRGSLHHRYLVR